MLMEQGYACGQGMGFSFRNLLRVSLGSFSFAAGQSGPRKPPQRAVPSSCTRQVLVTPKHPLHQLLPWQLQASRTIPRELQNSLMKGRRRKGNSCRISFYRGYIGCTEPQSREAVNETSSRCSAPAPGWLAGAKHPKG